MNKDEAGVGLVFRQKCFENFSSIFKQMFASKKIFLPGN